MDVPVADDGDGRRNIFSHQSLFESNHEWKGFFESGGPKAEQRRTD
jgi:hypothetical protein